MSLYDLWCRFVGLWWRFFAPLCWETSIFGLLLPTLSPVAVTMIFMGLLLTLFHGALFPSIRLPMSSTPASTLAVGSPQQWNEVEDSCLASYHTLATAVVFLFLLRVTGPGMVAGSISVSKRGAGSSVGFGGDVGRSGTASDQAAVSCSSAASEPTSISFGSTYGVSYGTI